MHHHERVPVVPELTEDFLLLRELGRGGSAVVYLGRDRELERDVAIKLIRGPMTTDEDSRLRFSREARTAALLNHPNIVGVHAVKRLRDGGLALVMQYVPGRTLKQVIRELGALEFDQVERVVRDIAAALGYAHERGVVHRDVKPENIFIHEGEGRALLSDFGIARTTETAAGLTLDGVAVGTPAYMAPEHVDGSGLDHRADLYSLGMVAWEMVTGEAPWEGESLYGIIYNQKHARLPALRDLRPDVPFHLWYLIETLTSKNRERRFESAAALRVELDAARHAGPWKRWMLSRRLGWSLPPDSAPQRSFSGSSRFATTPSVPSSTPDVLRVVVGRETPTGVETIRYRRSDVQPQGEHGAGSAGDNPSDSRRTSGTPSGEMEAPSGDDRSGNRGQVRDAGSAESFEGGAVNAVVPDIVLRRMPALSMAVMVALLLGMGATLLAVASPELETSELALAPIHEVVEPLPERMIPDHLRGFGRPVVATRLVSEAGEPTGDPVAADAAVGLDRDSAVGGAVADPYPREPILAPAAEEPVAAAPVESRVARLPARAVIAAGGLHTCSLTPRGEAYCWGGNSAGQIGSGGTTRERAPVHVRSGEAIGDISAGFAHTCALSAVGTPLCWGGNESGQLGIGSLASRSTPTRVAGARSFEAIQAGRSHSCALTARGEVFCWGGNGFGQLGDGTRTNRAAPVRVASEFGFTAISAGWNHTCALTQRGTVACWGQNAEGQLGNDATTDHNIPTLVGGRRSFAHVTAGGAHTCGLASNGAAFCWGRNTHGQLGDGSTVVRTAPVRVSANVPFTQLVAGGVHTCGLTGDGEAFCWGRNSYGQLGDGTTGDRTVPTRVEGRQRFSSLHASGSHTCGTTTAGEIFCWGYNVEGQLGDGTRTHQLQPMRVSTTQG
jgi:serine/threonine protein kinase/alpha-tubulin suppressor-like RCC1 family protein